MYAEIKTRLYDRMIDPGFGWIKGRLARGNHRCAVGCLYDMAAEDGLIPQNWADNIMFRSHTEATWIAHIVYQHAGLNVGEVAELVEFNDHKASSAAEVAEHVKTLPDTI
jgi:hypothetical protein